MTPKRTRATLALAILLLPVGLLAMQPASGLDPNPPKDVCYQQYCVKVLEFEELQPIYGVRADEPIFRKVAHAAHGFLTLNVSGDAFGFPTLLVEDENPFQFNGTIGPVRYSYEEKASEVVLDLEPHTQEVEPIGAIVRARVVVTENGVEKAFSAARSVRFYHMRGVETAAPTDLVALLQGFARDSPTTTTNG